MEALQTSETVNVVDDKHIERKFDASRHRLQTSPDNSDDGSEDGARDLTNDSPLYVAPAILRPVRPMVSNKHLISLSLLTPLRTKRLASKRTSPTPQ